MTLDQIFTEGWWRIVVLYAAIYLLMEYATYNIIFRSLMGKPTAWTVEEIRFWRRKAQFIGAVFFAPLFEEFIITYLAYTSFLQFSQKGMEGIVLILVAIFFALLHLPGDLHRHQNSITGIQLRGLIFGQFLRFFYSLTAYFVYTKTGTLWASIVLHYFANALVSVYNFDIQDGIRAVGSVNILRFLITWMHIGFGLFASYQFYYFSPEWSPYLIGAGVIYLLNIIVKNFRFR